MEMFVTLCSATDSLQLWKTDITGQLRTKDDESLCLKNKQNQNKLKMRLCPEGMGGFTFIFDAFFDTLLWVKNKADFETWGLRAVTLRHEPKRNTPRSTNVVIRGRRAGDTLQKWSIIYPDLPLDY